MTNAQKWISGFLLIFLSLFFLGQLTKEEFDDDNIGYMSSAQNVEKTGPELFVSVGCATCHGSDLNGTKSAPSLYSIEEFWSRDNLINYLRNPSSYSSNVRFKEYKKKYSDVMMPSYSNIDVKDLGKIADYILNLKK